MMRTPDSSFMYTMRIPADKSRAMSLINRPSGSLADHRRETLHCVCGGRKYYRSRVERVAGSTCDASWLDMGRGNRYHESHAAVAGYFYYFGVYYEHFVFRNFQNERPLYQKHLAAKIIQRQEQDGSGLTIRFTAITNLTAQRRLLT